MSPAQREKILEHLRKGHFITSACRFSGVARDSYYEERAKSPEFKAATELAIADAEEACLSAIRQDPAWQSRAWILERRFAERWARRDPAIPAPGGHVASVSLPEDPAERARVLRALAEHAEGGGK